MIAAIVLAGLIAVSAFGNATYFGVIHVPALALSLRRPGAARGHRQRPAGRRVLAAAVRVARRRQPDALQPLARAPSGGVRGRLRTGDRGDRARSAAASTFGSGYASTRHLLEGHADVPLLYVTLRVVATWLAHLVGRARRAVRAVAGDRRRHRRRRRAAAMRLGRADAGADRARHGGFLAAVTQAPITAFIIVMEMVDGHAMVLSLMAGGARREPGGALDRAAALRRARRGAAGQAGGEQVPGAGDSARAVNLDLDAPVRGQAGDQGLGLRLAAAVRGLRHRDWLSGTVHGDLPGRHATHLHEVVPHRRGAPGRKRVL